MAREAACLTSCLTSFHPKDPLSPRRRGAFAPLAEKQTKGGGVGKSDPEPSTLQTAKPGLAALQGSGSLRAEAPPWPPCLLGASPPACREPLAVCTVLALSSLEGTGQRKTVWVVYPFFF